jgi:Fur family peroxide stress response transcriptional regulator
VSRSRRAAQPGRLHPAPPTEADLAARTEHLVAQCREAGMNVTPQRIAIYRALLEATDHPSPEAIYARVRSGMPSLSLATIYKTLEALARLGLVSELPATGNSRRYDANGDRHHHLVCTRCNRVADYYDPALDRVPAPARLAGFRPQRVSVHIHGLCAACADAGELRHSSPRSQRRHQWQRTLRAATRTRT